MNTQLATTEVFDRPVRRTWRVRAVTSFGPVTIAGGVLWGLVQPWRITLLHPHGETFWWLFVQPPLLVIAVGLFFSFVVAPGVSRDLEESEAG